MKTIEIKSDEKYTQVQKQFMTELKSYITSEVNLLITNGNLASVLQDSTEYKSDLNEILYNVLNSENEKFKMYKLGKLDNLQIMVDPYMRWDDNRIILKYDDLVIEEIEIIDDGNMLL